MNDIHRIISEVDAYCAATGLKPTTVCNRALNNARLYDRLKTNADQVDRYADKLRSWMKDNPAEDRRGAA
tara:strand:- start:9412 stop:9621 length:210 start_codon:yes stop_codon:yes gene_type:complete